MDEVSEPPSRGQVGIDFAYGVCKNCDREIRTMTYDFEDYCSERCRKALAENGDSK